MLRRLRRPFERHLRGLVASGLSQDPTAQLQRLGMRLQREGAVQREQGAVGIAKSIAGVAELVPGERQVGIALQCLLQRAQRFAVALELDQGRTLEREREGRGAEVPQRRFRQAQRVDGSLVGAQQLEALGPARLQIGMRREDSAVGLLGVGDPALAGQPARARDGPLAWRVGKQVVRRRRPHGANIPAAWSLASRTCRV